MGWDLGLLGLFNRGLAHPFLDGWMALLSLATTPVPLLALALFLPGRRRERLLRAGVVVGTILAAVALQFLLRRPRPEGVRPVLPQPAFFSFPSGHAAAAFALATMPTLERPRRGWPALLGAVLVSLSRVYLGHHYPSDVLGGAILGTAVAVMAYGFFLRPDPTARPRWAWLLWGQLAAVALATLAASLGLIHFTFLALPGADKVLHLLLYGLLAFLAVGWWNKRPAWPVILAVSLLALAEEAVQLLLPGRSADPMDLLAGLAGIALLGPLGRAATKLSFPAKRD